jgi:hypothetical protein
VEFFNDVDESLVNLFRVLREPNLSRQPMSNSGLCQQWSYSVENSSAGMASGVKRWQAAIE